MKTLKQAIESRTFQGVQYHSERDCVHAIAHFILAGDGDDVLQSLPTVAERLAYCKAKALLDVREQIALGLFAPFRADDADAVSDVADAMLELVNARLC